MPTTPPWTPIARARSTRPVKTWVMSDIATGLSIDPADCLHQVRATISVSMFGEETAQ